VFDELERCDDIKRLISKAGFMKQATKYLKACTLSRLSSFARYLHAAWGESQLCRNGKQRSAGAAHIEQTERWRRQPTQQTESATQPPFSHPLKANSRLSLRYCTVRGVPLLQRKLILPIGTTAEQLAAYRTSKQRSFG
jgi:hypothetical protein